MTRGFLLVGPESSGTEPTAELPRRAGCRNVRRAYREIFAGIAELDLPYLVSSYEADARWCGAGPARTGPPPGAWSAGQR
ncbi:hypothetical protein ACNTMW_17625 [Planosporangium sp. 12N6]|uniref:hypothetical protein n=1 Tax=Planosporangium spinosum TaxID=3402278 RepID=UPI003CEF5D1E